VGTHGRSIWILDDLTPLREWTKDVEAKAAHLFTVRPAARWRYDGPVSSHVKGPGENPPRGALIQYWLKSEPAGEIAVEILDETGTLVRRLTSEKKEEPPEDDPDPEYGDERKTKPLPKEAGVQRAPWDLRYEGTPKIEKAKLDSGDPERGPMVLPGIYTVKLTVGDESFTAPLEVKPDPRVDVPRAALEEQLAFTLALRDDLTRLAGIVRDLRGVREQLRSRAAVLDERSSAPDLMAEARELASRLDTLESKLHTPEAEVSYDILAGRSGGAKLYSRLAPLYSRAQEGDGAPTEGMRQVRAMLESELDALETEWKGLLEKDLPALNGRAREAGVGFVVAPQPQDR
jgi:hypothetical protein